MHTNQASNPQTVRDILLRIYLQWIMMYLVLWKSSFVRSGLLSIIFLSLTLWQTGGQKVCPSGYTAPEGKCEDIDECSGNLGQCSQICTNTEGSYQCSCYHGYYLDSDRWTCRAEGPPFYLIFSQGTDIYTLRPEGTGHRALANNLGKAVAIDYHFQYETIFWLDDMDNILYKALLDGTQKQDILKLGDVTAVDLAVDWIHDNIYWTDALNNNIEMSTLDGNHRQTLTHLALQPRSIVVDPVNGWLYLSCWGASPRIIQSKLDGTEMSPLVYSSIVQPNGLTLDFIDERLYWVDNGTKTLESIHVNGTDRQIVHFMGDRQAYSLSMFLDHVYWTDWKRNTITRANKYNGGDIVGISTNLLTKRPMDVTVVHPYRQPWSKPISARDCNSTGCPEPKPLPYKPFAVFANTNDIRRINFDGTDYRRILHSNLRNVVALDYDPVGKALYYADADLNMIEKVSIDGSNRQIVVGHDINGCEGLAIDWIHRKLYWAERENGRIVRSELDGSNREVIISQNISSPRGIAVYPHLDLLYWTDLGEEAKIEVSSLDGRRRAVLVSENITWPNGIAIDYDANKIIWADGKYEMIQEMKLDGTERRIVTNDQVGQPFSVTQFKENVWYTDVAHNMIIRVNKETGVNRVQLRGGMNRPSGLQIIHPSAKKVTNTDINPCSILNGKCEQLCYQDVQLLNKAVCACRHGYRLHADGTSCLPDECESGLADCDENALCIDTPNGYQCLCRAGYTGNGVNCTEIPVVTTEVPKHHDTCPEAYVLYCLNGGTCLFYDAIDELACECVSGFTGKRCQYRDITAYETKAPMMLQEKIYISVGVVVPVVLILTIIVFVCCYKSRRRNRKHHQNHCAAVTSPVSTSHTNVCYENKGQAERYMSSYSSPAVARNIYSKPDQGVRNGSVHSNTMLDANINGRLPQIHAAVLNNSDIMSPKRSGPLLQNGTSHPYKDSYVGFNRRQVDIPESIRKSGELSPVYATPGMPKTPVANQQDADYMDMSQGVSPRSAVYINLDSKPKSNHPARLHSQSSMRSESDYL
ncbi:low-density lipoprotein receptor-related protein 4-like [Ptychodera flava]|uniref:low-density lipoprotein receptor-related protein 4-like n=1 Tax=Ptychodera flava TaxID=63121 RepID=UPI003969C086